MPVPMARHDPSPNDPPSPLMVELTQGRWRRTADLDWIADVEFRITNTSCQPILLREFRIAADVVAPGELPLPVAEEVCEATARERERLRNRHELAGFLEPTYLDTGESVTGWLVEQVRRFTGTDDDETARCVLTVTDETGYSYGFELAMSGQARPLPGL